MSASQTGAVDPSSTGAVPVGRPDISDIITVVRDKKKAAKVLEKLAYYNENTPDGGARYWACDTEVMDIDLKTVGPVGNGHVTCISIYGGPDVDFGDGPGAALWIDNLGDAEGILQEFKGWLEDPAVIKVWHNYGFDRHVVNNEDIDVKGFGGDTMHMARLWDTSRDRMSGGVKGGEGGYGYGLDDLSRDLIEDERFTKVKMKELFGVPRLKRDGSEGKVKDLPAIETIQTNPESRDLWIQYSARDAMATWWICEEITAKLRSMPWVIDNKKMGNLYDFYTLYLKDFGELLTDMESNGIRVDTKGHLRSAEILARAERAKMREQFLVWAEEYCPDARDMNIASPSQLQQFFFGQWEMKGEGWDKKPVLIAKVREFKVDKTEEELAFEVAEVESANPYAGKTSPQLKDLLRERGLKLTGKKTELVARLLENDVSNADTNSDGGGLYGNMPAEELMDVCIARGLSWSKGSVEEERASMLAVLHRDALYVQEVNTAAIESSGKSIDKPKKYREITISTLGVTPEDFTPSGQPQVSAPVLRKLAGSDVLGPEEEAVWGRVYDHFGGGEQGKAACRAIGALAKIGQIDATITNFLVPLQFLVDKDSRIHCSLNLNTETGRLSSRRPNLQNQPALEKDSYKIRDAFVAEEGKSLIVADYGQLELRLLAHITSCESMLHAFDSGGCFHSRTAMGMYPKIKQAVDDGEVLLEWDYSKGQPTSPLVKDTYGSERRKAKTLNFSIAYGKTVHGLANDWGISQEEAEETLQAWYSDRQEVKLWQDNTRDKCKKKGWVRTLMGRYRLLPDAMLPDRDTKTRQSNRGRIGHSMRAAINTPIQGSAADVVMMAMIKLWKRCDWRLCVTTPSIIYPSTNPSANPQSTLHPPLAPQPCPHGAWLRVAAADPRRSHPGGAGRARRGRHGRGHFLHGESL